MNDGLFPNIWVLVARRTQQGFESYKGQFYEKLDETLTSTKFQEHFCRSWG